MSEQFEEYLLEHFVVQRVSGKTQFLIDDDCPFCGSNGRLYVDRKKGVGICFKCSTGFDAAKFVAEHEGVSRGQAVRILSGQKGFQSLEDEEELEAMEIWFPPTVPVTDHPAAFGYLTERGISEKIMTKFVLSYCDQNVQIGDKTYWTENRIIIPIFNKDGKAVGWQGRDMTGKSKIKYLFMPGFKGAENLYNIHQARQNYVILCEGVMDVYGWVRAGFTSALGSFGKKISDTQLDMLSVINPNILFLAWDSDAAGEIYSFVERHSHRFKQIRLVDMVGYDADECDKKTLANCLTRATDYDWSQKIINLL